MPAPPDPMPLPDPSLTPNPIQLDYSAPRKFRAGDLWWPFCIASAISFLVAASTVICQQAGWGIPLMAGVEAGTLDRKKPAHEFVLYGVGFGKHYVMYAEIFPYTAILPAMWPFVALSKFMLPWALRPSALQAASRYSNKR